ncbi:hypothetical protein COCOBI_17-1620 [Coccomyxa sp. Obi]|nr:hypothetical protein COCOBI_17-1620 [Coccomyxa sp. Obi]
MRPELGSNASFNASSGRLHGSMEQAFQKAPLATGMRGNKEKKGQAVRCPRRTVAPEATATRPAKAILADIAMKRATLQPLDLILGRTPVQRASQTAKEAAVELLRAPDGAVVKEGSASGKQIRCTKQRRLAAKEQCSHADHPAVEVVRARMRGGSRPGQRRDGFKVGLVVEGGGMRGVVTGAALQAMHDLGLRNAFDAVYGSSAGAINATYFLSGQRDGVNIYTEEIANQQFIDLRRLFKKDQAPALDLGYLLNVMHHKRPLDWEAVLKSDVPLKVVASCLDTLQPIILEDFTSAQDLETCLRASANVPEVAGRPIEHRGRRLVDAAVFEPVPFRAAIADGCTHLITLCSRPPFEGGRVAKIIDSLVSDAVKRFVMNPEYMRAAWMREMENNILFGMTTDEMLVRGLGRDSHQLPHFAGVHVFPVFPGAAAQAISPLCTEVALLQAGLDEGRAMVARVFAPAAAAPAAAAPAPMGAGVPSRAA